MQLMVTTPDGNVFPVDTPDDMCLEDFFAVCREESTFLKQLPPDANLEMFHNGKVNSERKSTLAQLGLKAGDLVMIRPAKSAAVRTTTENLISSE